MLNLSHYETSQIRNIIANNKRLDSRNLQEHRNITFQPLHCYQSDSYLRVYNGSSILEISIRFDNCEQYRISGNVSCQHLINIEKILETYKLGLEIDVNIVNDDGGTMCMIYEGLRHIFKNLYMPDLENLRCDGEITINLPFCKTYALFDCEGVLDPTKHEEMSSDGLIHIFILDNKMIGTEIEKANNIDYYALEATIQYNT